MRRRAAKRRDEVAVPASFAAILGEFRGCFSAWTFPVFCALACGLVAQQARRTVCAMLVGAQLSRTWSHHRAHRFFSHSRWSVDQLSAVIARLVVRALVPADQPVLVAIDDTLFKRRGPKVLAASWFHDGSAPDAKKVGYGNNWVIAAIVVRVGFVSRPIALPVAFFLVRKGSDHQSRLEGACRIVELLSEALDGRRIDVVADAAYAGKVLRDLPPGVTWTTRPRSNAALYALAPPLTGRRGRPRTTGERLAPLSVLAKEATFTKVEVTRYSTTTTIEVATIRCLWYGVFGRREVQVVLVRDTAKNGYDVALVTTDLDVGAGSVIERYAARWSIEVSIEDAKQTGGVGQARNRVERAVERTVPFALIVNTLTVYWYATVGYHSDDVDERRSLAPWYRNKTQPSVLDMFTKLRRVIVAGYLRPVDLHPPTPEEIRILRLAWEDVAA
jgi:hypothetical protein